MPQYFHRLENALKRANEFIDVGKKLEALEILCDVLRSRKHRTWQKNHADIMVKYLELCVELRKSYIAKEGIYQYKIICQQTQIKSFEDVVRKYLELAESKAEAAKEAAQAATIADVDDLDNLATPENILLSAVSSEVSQDRTDRVLLLPWVKFLWESYRQCLDLLKNNARTEKLYHDIAHKAFQFCIKFNRKTEFRKLCDNLHTHLDILKKQQQQLIQPTSGHVLQNIVNLSNPDSQALHLETRLQQLDCAITMELWQEAYKATDDIKRFNLMNLSKKPLKPQLMASYYQKLALVFYKANCPLFHAAALLRHFLLTKEWRKNIKEEEVSKMASKVVAATLSMPIPPTRPEIDKLVDTEENVVENHHRNLASLLGLSVIVPSRGSLIRDLKRMNILAYAYPELQQLYQWLEQDFDPLLLCKRVESVIGFIEKSELAKSADLKAYIQPLKEVAIVRLLKEISQIYSTIQLNRILELCPFADTITLEHFVVSAARRNDLQVRIDHRRGCLHFGTGQVSGSEEVIEGPHIQSMASSQIRSQLVSMFSALQNARALIEPEKIKNHRDKLKLRTMIEYDRNKNIQHKKILERSKIIEKRRDEIQQMKLELMAQEERQAEEAQALRRKEEEARIKKEAEERARLRLAQEEEDLKRRMAKDTIDTMRLTEAGQKILETFGESELADLKVEDIKSKQWEQLEKERKEQVVRQQKLEKKVDHLERAKRLEELPLFEESFKKDVILNKEIFERMELQRIEELKAERTLALTHRDRLLRMKSEASAFAQKIKSQRYAEYEVKVNDWKRKIEQARVARLEERKKKREEDRRRDYYKKIKEAEDARKAEAQRILEEELKREEEEQKRKFDELARKQQERDAEIEAKLAEQDRLRQRQEPASESIRPPAEEQRWRGSGTQERQRANEPVEPWRREGGGGGGAPPQSTEPVKQVWRPRRQMEQASDEQHVERPPPPPGPSDKDEKWRARGAVDRAPLSENRGPLSDDRRLGDLPQRHPVEEEKWTRGGGLPDRGGRTIGDRGETDRRDHSKRDFGDHGKRDFGDHGKRDFGDRDGRSDNRDYGDDNRRGVGGGRFSGQPRDDRSVRGQPRDEDWGRPPRRQDDQGGAQKAKKVIPLPPHMLKQESAQPPQQRPVQQQKEDGGSDEGWEKVKKR